jgi:hypothetical protein
MITMQTSKSERLRAELVSAAVDELLRDPSAQPGPLDAADAELLETVRALAQLPALLGPVDPALEQRVLRQVRAGAAQARRRPRLRVAWAIASLVLLLLAATLLTPLGQTALAQFMAVFRLGRTEVRITPADTTVTPTVAVTAAIKHTLSLEEAQGQVAFAIPQPTYLPPGHSLHQVNTYTYPDLPAWVPQPFSLELIYEDGVQHEISLRLYPILLGDKASISHLNLEAGPIQDVQEVDVNGQAGVLMRVGTNRVQATWQEVVWEQDDLILALSAAHLSEADLLRIARSVH